MQKEWTLLRGMPWDEEEVISPAMKVCCGGTNGGVQVSGVSLPRAPTCVGSTDGTLCSVVWSPTPLYVPLCQGLFVFVASPMITINNYYCRSVRSDDLQHDGIMCGWKLFGVIFCVVV